MEESQTYSPSYFARTFPGDRSVQEECAKRIPTALVQRRLSFLLFFIKSTRKLVVAPPMTVDLSLVVAAVTLCPLLTDFSPSLTVTTQHWRNKKSIVSRTSWRPRVKAWTLLPGSSPTDGGSIWMSLHDVTCTDLKRAYQRTAEFQRKARDAHERTQSHRERCRRATKEHVKSEAAINHHLGCSGWLVRETANASHALTCGVPDREGNETKYLREATEMIEEWKGLPQLGPSVSHPSCEHSEVF